MGDRTDMFRALRPRVIATSVPLSLWPPRPWRRRGILRVLLLHDGKIQARAFYERYEILDTCAARNSMRWH